MADITVSANIHSFMQAANSAAARTVLEAAGLGANTFTGLQTVVGLTYSGDILTTGAGRIQTRSFVQVFDSSGAANRVMIGETYGGVRLALNYGIGFTLGDATLGADLRLERAAAATLQLGEDHATTPTAQTIKAHDVTTGTGASLTLAGGDGSGSKGNVILNGGNRAALLSDLSTGPNLSGGDTVSQANTESELSAHATAINSIIDTLISHGLMAAS